MENADRISMKYNKLSLLLDERSFRFCMAADAESLGYGSVSQVVKSSGASRTTIHTGIQELRQCDLKLDEKVQSSTGRVRRPGAGRKRQKETDETLLADMDTLLDPVTRGDPMSALRRACKSTTNLAAELQSMGHAVSQATVWRLLDELGYSMQSNRKTREGIEHEDRNAQFQHINTTVNDFLRRNLPVISVDTKKKELIGNFKNGGREWQRKGEPLEVNMHDFAGKELGKAIPYGV
ncbi:MAG: hypothetical protein HBSAPP01_27270 [Candidatus Brocadia sapporoensis]|nr:MAG: hypothetical protein HBSAPP01_27270 [Candidatus Brocadia sapporoensis]